MIVITDTNSEMPIGVPPAGLAEMGIIGDPLNDVLSNTYYLNY